MNSLAERRFAPGVQGTCRGDVANAPGADAMCRPCLCLLDLLRKSLRLLPGLKSGSLVVQMSACADTGLAPESISSVRVGGHSHYYSPKIDSGRLMQEVYFYSSLPECPAQSAFQRVNSFTRLSSRLVLTGPD